MGRPGAGKSSFAAALVASDSRWRQLAMARPLYAAQAALLDRTGVRPTELAQDGELLSFLGGHIRRLDPDSLTRRVIERADWLQAVVGERAIVISDARPVDLPALRGAGFATVLVRAPEASRRVRLRDRADLTANPDYAGIEVSREEPAADILIDNDGSLSDLFVQAGGFLERLSLITPSVEASAEAARIEALGLVLRQEARDAIGRVYRPSRHQLGCAMLGDDGEIATGVHIEAEVGRASSCAENGALAQTIARGARPVALITVRHPRPEEVRGVDVMPPCGVCRELIGGYGAEAMVWLNTGPARLQDLLPHRYAGTKWSNGG